MRHLTSDATMTSMQYESDVFPRIPYGLSRFSSECFCTLLLVSMPHLARPTASRESAFSFVILFEVANENPVARPWLHSNLPTASRTLAVYSSFPPEVL